MEGLQVLSQGMDVLSFDLGENDNTPNPSKCVAMNDRSNNSVSNDVVLTNQWRIIYVWGI